MPEVPRRRIRDARADARLARWLVRAYPRDFRESVGDAFVDASLDRMQQRRRRGWPVAGIWMIALADTLRHAPAARTRGWLDARPARSRPRAMNPGERTMMDKLLQDVRYALRLWRKRPGFAAVAILTLALGIGANTAMFSIVNAVLLRPLPYANADRLVSVWSRTAQFPRGLLSYPEYEELQKQSGSLETLALYLGQSVNLTGVAEPQRLTGSFVTGSFFDVLGLKAERGRLFTEDESAPGSVKPVVVITRQFWQQRFGGDPDIIGRSITLNGIVLTVVGVMAPPFDVTAVPSAGYFIDCDLFLPAAQYPTPRGLRNAGPQMLAVGLLKPGVAIRTASADIDVLSKRLTAADPNAQAGRTIEVGSAQENIVGSSRTALFLLFAAVGVVLLIACVNVSHLLLARAMDRQKEIALRAALGASRGAVTRQLAVEAALVAMTSAVAGFLLGRWALSAVAFLRPQTWGPAGVLPSVPIPTQVRLDWTVLLFTGGIAIGVAVLCGLTPALKTSRPDLSRVLQAGARRASGSGRRTRDILIVAEIAMSVALVAVSALLIQSLLAVQSAPTGFDASNVFTLQFRLPQTKYAKPEDIARFFKAAIENVRAVPGVQSAALVRAVPFSGNGGTTGYAAEGRPAPNPASLPQARFQIVTPDYFKTLRIPLLKGRDFTDRDDLTTPLVAVISETFARQNWPDEDPVSKRFTTPNTPSPVTVIGVVGDTKHYTATEPTVPQLYVAHYQVPLIFSSLVARTSVPPMSITNEVRKAIWAVDKDQPVWSIYSLETAVARTQGQSRFLALLLGIFAGVALLLAGVGIYGMTSYGVSQRTHEIGIRLALGASSERVLREVVGHGVRLTIIAVVIGLAVAVGMGRLAGAVLFQVTPGDPRSLAAAAFILGVVSLLACYWPARRAARVDPVVALSEE